MAVTSGFFNSLYGDRKYNAEQFSAMFDNLITDGVFSNVGNAFQVTADGSNVLIDVGRAWFDSVWVYNDTLYPLPVQPSEVLLDRIDAVVIEINHTEAIRAGRIFFVQGTASADPERPVLTNTEDIHQYPLAYVYRKAGASTVTQADVTNMIGTSSCPYVTGILATQDIDKVVAQWEAQFNQWFEDLQIELSGDVAANLASQIIEIDARFEELARTGRVYEDLQDSNNDTILDSQSRVIEGSTSFRQRNEDPPSGTGTSGDVNNLKMDIVRLDGQIDQTNNRVDSVSPKVGDVISTVRTNLGSDYLLCNGAVVSRSSYPELSPLIPFNPEGPWVKRTTLGDDLKQIATGLNYYVGVEDYNVYYATSLTGTWAHCMPWSAGGDDRMKASAGIVFGKNYFVMPILYYDSGWFYHTRIYYFQNPTAQGASYSELSVGEAKEDRPLITLSDIAFSGSYFAAVGHETVSSSDQDKAIAYVSANPNGPWTKKDLWSSSYTGSTDAMAFTISYANGYFIAVGYIRESVSRGTNLAIAYTTSPTGTWTYKKLFTDTPSDDASDGTFSVTKVVYANGKYSFAFSYGNTVYIVESTSPSGTWSYHVVVRNKGYNGYTGVQKLYYIDGFYLLCLPDGYTGDSTVLYSRSSHGPWFRMCPLGTDAIQSLFDTSSMLFASGTDYCGTLDKNSMQLPSISSGLTYSYIKAKT